MEKESNKKVEPKNKQETKETWKCPRCNNVNLITIMYCTLCKREQPF